MTDCRNDCRDPVLFPRRVVNRPGLDRIAYRIGTYSEIREALLHWLDQDAGLSQWTHRESDDPGIALLDGAAIVGDILTFYQEHYANETFLRTAAWRESVADLVRLIGYRLSPGVGGRATFAFEVRGEKPVTIPKGFPVAAEVTGREGQSDFETVTTAEAIPALSRFSLYRPAQFAAIAAGMTRFSIESAMLVAAGVTLDAGDRLMIVVNRTNTSTYRQIVVVDKVERKFERTEITIKGAWQGSTLSAPVTAYKLGRSFRFFGYNAPETITVVTAGVANPEDVSFAHQVGVAPGMGLAHFANMYYPLPSLASFPLDQQVSDLAAGATMLVRMPLGTGPTTPVTTSSDFFFERYITSVHPETMTVGALTGGSTVVDLNLDTSRPFESPSALIYTDLRLVKFDEVIGTRFAITGARTPTSTSDVSRLLHYGERAAYDALDARRVQLARSSEVEDVTLATDPAASAPGVALRPVILNPPLRIFALVDFPLETPTVVAYGNVVDAAQGHTEREAVLGNGDSRQTFQTFKLPKSPLTYHNAAGATPPETPELDVYVGGRRWTQVASFFGRGPKEQIYVVREDADEVSWIQFGDDKTGARLPSGLGNVTAVWRTGNAAYGPLRDGTTVETGKRLDRLDKIRLLDVATGGELRESADNAREAAPGKLQALGRLVSIVDYETETLAIAGVWRASARWALVSNVPAIVLTILMRTGRDAELATVRDVLAEANRCRGPDRYPVVVVAGELEYLYCGAIVAIDPTFKEATVLAAIKEALGLTGAESDGIDASKGLLATGRRRFGEREYATRIEGTIQNVAGVLWARVHGIGSLGTASDHTTLTLPAAPWPRVEVVDCAPNRILALHRLHLDLSTIATPSKACQ